MDKDDYEPNDEEQLADDGLEDIIENKITKMDTMRVPVNGAYETPIRYQGIGFIHFIYLDTKEGAQRNLEKYR